MKHAIHTRLLLVLAVIIGIGTMGFQCSSPNITSGKLYYQQYESSKDKAKLDKALEAFEKEVAENPNSAEGWYWIGLVQGMKKNYLALHTSWDKSAQLGPGKKEDMNDNRMFFFGQAYNQGANLFKKAQLKNDNDLYLEAVDAFKAATLLEPDTAASYGAYLNLAYCYLSLGEPDKSFNPLKAQNAKKPMPEAYSTLAKLTVGLGHTAKQNGKDEQAKNFYQNGLNILNEGLEKFPDNQNLTSELLNTYIAADRVTEAIQQFKTYASAHTEDAGAQYACGTALLQIKEYEESITYLERAVALAPDMESALYNLSVAYLRLGINIRDADNSTDPEARQVDYKSVIKKGLPHIKHLLEIAPDNAVNWDLAGKFYASVGMTKEATEAYDKTDKLREK